MLVGNQEGGAMLSCGLDTQDEMTRGQSVEPAGEACASWRMTGKVTLEMMRFELD